MKSHLTHLKKSAFILLFSCLFQASYAQTEEKLNNVHLGFVYPISTNGAEAAQYTNNFSFHILTGVSKEERSVAFAGITNIIKENAFGIQFAGISNHIGGTVKGIQFAGIFNQSGANTIGIQSAGIANLTRDITEGIQYAGIYNDSKMVKGLQFAGILNRVNSMDGFQFSGFSNVSGNIRGMQFAGFLNKADHVNGSQFAGFINVAKKVRGIQFAGFINVADSSDHPIGLINIVKNGEKSVSLSVDEIQNSLLTFRSGGRVLYGIVAAGYNWKEKDKDILALEAGFGAHLSISNRFRINTELSSTYLEDWTKGEYFKSSLKLLPSFKISKIELFAGPSLNFSQTDTDYGKEFIKNEWWSKERNGELQQLFLGYTAGLGIRF